MTIDCDKKTFDGFKRLIGVHREPPDSLLAFCHEALAEDMSYLSELYVPELNLNSPPLEDWSDFENWCDDLTPGLMHLICGDEVYSEIRPPRSVFNDSTALKQALLTALMEQDNAIKYSCGVVEIQCNEEVLALIFTGLDNWYFESGDLLVTKTYEEITEERGFYTSL